MQTCMEDNAYKLHIPQGKPWQQMAENVTASVVLAQQSEKVWHATLCSFAPAIELHLQSKDVQMCMKGCACKLHIPLGKPW